MKIRVTTSRFEYQGLYKGSEHEVDSVACGTELDDADYYQFKHNGKMWSLSEGEVLVVIDPPYPYQVVFDEQGGYKAYDKNGTLREVRSKTNTLSSYDSEGILKARIGILTEECRSPYCECDKGECSGGKVDKRGEGEMSSALDKQEGGGHYKGCKIQPIEYIHANNLDYLQGNVIKYTTRHKDKNKEQDIRKAIHYLELILELQYGIK